MGPISSPIVQIYIGVYILAALGFFIWMYAGQFCLAVGGLMAVGAYSASILTVEAGVPLILAMLISGIITGILGGLLSIPALRMQGFYLAIATLGISELILVFFRLFPYTGQLLGYKGMFGTTVSLTFATVIICFLLTVRLVNSRLGWAFKAIRLDEVAAQSLGINLLKTKVLAMVMGGLLIGMSGALYAHFISFIRAEHFGLHLLVLVLAFLILGGMETPWGLIISTMVLTLLPEYIRPLAEWRMIIYGITIMAVIVLRPQGLISERETRAVKRLLSHFRR